MISVDIFSEKGKLTRHDDSTWNNQSESSKPSELHSQKRFTEPSPSPQSTPSAIRPRGSYRGRNKRTGQFTKSHTVTNDSFRHSSGIKQAKSLIGDLDWRQKAKEINIVLWNHPKSGPFKKPVDPVRDDAEDYYDKIKNPMDLNTLAQSLIGDDSVAPTTTPKEYVKKLMLIWDNAQEYNHAGHWIHDHAASLRTHSVKLIKSHFPQIDVQSYIPSAKFDPSKGLLCGVCSQRLSFEVGYHEKCESLKNRLSSMKCTECHRKLDNPRTPFYHCLSGCTQRRGSRGDKAHSIFLCTSCAEEKYHSKQLMIDNKSDSRNIAFRGLFLDLESLDNRDKLWAIVIRQNVPQVSYELVLSTNNESSQVTNAIIVDEGQRRIKVVEEQEASTDWQDATLSVDGRKLTFYDSKCPENTTTFDKIVPECVHCGADMLFMERGHLPCDDHDVWCDTHGQYYETQKHLSIKNRCAGFKEMDPKNATNQIYKERFYFSCNECCRFEMCRVCALIKSEMEFKKERVGDERKERSQDSVNVVNARHSEERDTVASGSDKAMERVKNVEVRREDSGNEVPEQEQRDRELNTQRVDHEDIEGKQGDQNEPADAAITVNAVPGLRGNDARKRINASVDLLDQLRKASPNNSVLTKTPDSSIGSSTATTIAASTEPIRLSPELSSNALCSNVKSEIIQNVKSGTNQNHNRQPNEPPNKKQRITESKCRDIHRNNGDGVDSNDPIVSHPHSVSNTSSRKRERDEMESELNQDMDILSDDINDESQGEWELKREIAELKKQLAENQVRECDIGMAQQQLKLTNRKYRQYREGNHRLREQIQKERDAFNLEREVWEKERKDHNEKIDKCRQQVVHYQKERDSMESERDSVKNKMKHALMKIVKVQKKLDETKRKLSAFWGGIQNHAQRLGIE